MIAPAAEEHCSKAYAVMVAGHSLFALWMEQITDAMHVIDGLQVQQEMSLVKSQPLKSSEPLKSSLETVGAQVKLEAATITVVSPGASLPGCSVRSLLNDMGLQVRFNHLKVVRLICILIKSSHIKNSHLSGYMSLFASQSTRG